MNNIDKAFVQKKKPLIGFITAGDPDLQTTKKNILAMVRGGIDIVELGIPFSDPVAGGEIIRRADKRALAAGTTTDKILSLVQELRQETNVPVVLFAYANQIYVYGLERFFARCEAVGVDGIIIPDIPYEERDEFAPCCLRHQVALVPAAVCAAQERLCMIAEKAQGYIRLLLPMKVTHQQMLSSIQAARELVSERFSVPVAAVVSGNSAAQAAEFAKAADSIVISSALVEITERYGANAPEHIYACVQEIAEALA